MVSSVTNSAGEVRAEGLAGGAFKTATVWSTSDALVCAIWTDAALSLGQLTSMTANSRRTSAPPAKIWAATGRQHLLHSLATQVGDRFILTAACISIATSVSTRWSRYASSSVPYSAADRLRSVVVAICQLDSYPDQAPLKLVAIERDEMVDCTSSSTERY